MTKAEIKEFKKYLIIVLVRKYKMSRTEAHRAVRDSSLSEILKQNSDYVMHDTLAGWAKFIFDEVQSKQNSKSDIHS